jgi:peptide deformylase
MGEAGLAAHQCGVRSRATIILCGKMKEAAGDAPASRAVWTIE